MTKWNNLTTSATAAEIIKAGKLGINDDERCDLSDLLHGVNRKVLFEMLDMDEHTAHFLMSGSSMPTKTMIDICNEHAGMKNPREVQKIRDDYEKQIANLREQVYAAESSQEDALHAVTTAEDKLHATEQEIIVLKARLYDILIGETQKTTE